MGTTNRMLLRGLALLALLGAFAAGAAETESTAAPTAGRQAVVMLPVQARLLKPGFALRYSEHWSATARTNLEAAVDEIVRQSEKFRAVEMPPITPDERAVIDEFMAVAELAAAHRGVEKPVWKADDPASADDRTLGPALQFLRDRTGADLAIGVVGTQVEYTKTQLAVQSAVSAALVFVFWPALAPGAGPVPAALGNHAVIYLVDLRTGELTWFNVQEGYAIVGMHSWNLLDAESTRKVVQKLVDAFPDAPPSGHATASTPPAQVSFEPRHRASPIEGEFSLKLPTAWNVTSAKVAVAASRNDIPLNQLSVELLVHVRAFPITRQKSTPTSSPARLAEQCVDELRAQQLTDLTILETSTEATLAGKPAFRIHFTYMAPESMGHFRLEQVVLGTALPRGLLIAQYAAPHLRYFAKSQPAFEEAVTTLTRELHQTLR